MISLSVVFWELCWHDNNEHSQQLKRSRLKGRFCVAVFLIGNICLKTLCFWFHEVAKFMKWSKKFQLNHGDISSVFLVLIF